MRAAQGRDDMRLGTDVVTYVRLLDADPLLLRGLPSDVVVRLRGVLTAPLLAVPRRGAMPYVGSEDAPLCLLILGGLMTRAVSLAGRSTVELLGPGDVIRPWQEDSWVAGTPVRGAWTALEPTRVAVLDGDFAAAAFRFPTIAEELMQRVIARCNALLERLAIVCIPSLSQRLVMLLWHLADRWGRVEREGVVVPLRLSHQLLSELVCAQRPSVSVALRHVVDEGWAVRTAGGGWLLRRQMPHQMQPGASISASVV